MHLICTTKGTARLMTDDEVLQDLDIGILNTHRFLSKSQKDELYNWAKTEITDAQLSSIKTLAGV